jgi:hypothetical protein
VAGRLRSVAASEAVHPTRAVGVSANSDRPGMSCLVVDQPVAVTADAGDCSAVSWVDGCAQNRSMEGRVITERSWSLTCLLIRHVLILSIST